MLRALLAALLAVPASAQAPDTLRAALDLRGPIADGWLDPGVHLVGLRGGVAPLSWEATTPAHDPDGDGVYRLAVPFVLDGDSLAVALKIKVDDAPGAPNRGWQLGPDHTVTLRRGTGADLALAWADRPPPPPSVVTGTVERIEGVGGMGLAARDVYVWLPPGYAASDARYPVLYLHDGENAFDAAVGGADWGMDEAAQAGIEAGEIAPLLIVGVASTDARMDEYTPTARRWERVVARTGPPTDDGPDGPITGTYAADGDSLVVAVRDGVLMIDPPEVESWVPIAADAEGRYALPGSDITFAFRRGPDGVATHLVATRPEQGGRGEAYGDFLVDVVKPLVDARYRTRPGPEDTGVGGISLGGLISMHLGATRPDVFGRVLAGSPSVWWDEQALLRTVAAATPPPGQRVWVDIGTAEGGTMVPDARGLAALLVETGWDAGRVRYVEAPDAAHDWGAWAARAPDALRFLFPPE